MAKRALNDERGFTLPELLVVVLIIGILAAISLTVFLRQQDTANDGAAKASARELVTLVETCNTEKNDYTACQSAAQLGPTGLSVGPGAGRVQVTDAASDTYTVRAHSLSGNKFDISRGSSGLRHACTTPARGGCHADGSW
jgi:prepilin-type N-terminal cleavage/methylation domain-containing protein